MEGDWSMNRCGEHHSFAAVETYLDIRDLQAVVDLISARTCSATALLKPSPFLVIEAANRLAAPVSRCTLVGDSVTDVEASHAAQATAIGYANKHGKADRLASAGAAVIITDTSTLITAQAG